MKKQRFTMKNKRNMILIICVTLIILVVTWKLYSTIFYKVDKVSRIVTNPDNVTIVEPRNVEDVVLAVRYAKKNGMKVTALSGGHSYYFMRDFPKLQSENLMVIDTKNMKTIEYLEENNRVFFEAGVNAGDIKRFNLTLNNVWCPHGNCDGVGLGFWVNSVSGLGGLFYPFSKDKNSGIASDLIRKINYVDFEGNLIELDNPNSDDFKALKMCAGMFGIITSLEVEPFSSRIPSIWFYVLKQDITECKNTVKKLLSNPTLNDSSTQLWILNINSWVTIKVSSTGSLSCDDIGYILAVDYGLDIYPVVTKLLDSCCGSLSNINGNYFYKYILENNWNTYHIGIPYNLINTSIINEIFDIYQSVRKRVMHSGSWYLPERFRSSTNPEAIFYWIDFSVVSDDEYGSSAMSRMTNLLKDIPGKIMYLNEPSINVPFNDYFTPYSPLSYNEFVRQKQIMDPNGMFVTRFNLSGQ